VDSEFEASLPYIVKLCLKKKFKLRLKKIKRKERLTCYSMDEWTSETSLSEMSWSLKDKYHLALLISNA
jgi:hypothetical protein